MPSKKKRCAKTLPNGRSAPSHPQYVRIPHEIIKSKKFCALKGSSVKILLYLCSKHTGSNNRRIACSCDELARTLKMGKATALECLDQLQKSGFIQCVKKGYFTGRMASEWEITFLPSEGYEPTHLWKDPAQRPHRPNLRPVKLDHIQKINEEIKIGLDSELTT